MASAILLKGNTLAPGSSGEKTFAGFLWFPTFLPGAADAKESSSFVPCLRGPSRMLELWQNHQSLSVRGHSNRQPDSGLPGRPQLGCVDTVGDQSLQCRPGGNFD